MWHPFISFLFSKLRETFNQIFHDISTIILRSSNKLKQTEADLLPTFFATVCAGQPGPASQPMPPGVAECDWIPRGIATSFTSFTCSRCRLADVLNDAE